MSGPTEHEKELAKNLWAAALATDFGVGLTYARKHYIDQNPDIGEPGAFWIALARTVIDVKKERIADLLNAANVSKGATR